MAKEICERKLAEKDLNAAKSFAMKACQIYPGLDGLSQLIATIDIYVNSEKKMNGEVDCYKVLGVESTADDDTIRRNYKKLALQLHPDKNKSVGAAGAFKILSDAWSLLSDKARRTAYDQKCRLWHIQQRAHSAKSSVVVGHNGFSNSTVSNFSMATDANSSAQMRPPFAAPDISSTFWTKCTSCKMYFEYRRFYVNCNLKCSNCQQTFMAYETPSPFPHVSGSSIPSNSYNQQHVKGENFFTPQRKQDPAINIGQGIYSGRNLSKISRFGSSASEAAQEAGSVHLSREQLKEQMKGQPAATLSRKTSLSSGDISGSAPMVKRDRPKKKQRLDERGTTSDGKEKVNAVTKENVGAGTGIQRGDLEERKTKFPGTSQLHGTRKPLLLQLLVEKSKEEIKERLKIWGADAARKTAEKQKTSVGVNVKDKGKHESDRNDAGDDLENGRDIEPTMKEVQDNKLPPAENSLDSDTSRVEPVSMAVPDADFLNFDAYRTEKSFCDNQVWAAYDDDDGMPRYYAMVHSVISLNPFKMRLSWLNSRNNNEFGPLDWVDCGFPKTSGIFRAGKQVTYDSLNAFSHPVKWKRGNRGVIEIYPQKGDVWAIYRNWSSDWNEHTPDEVIQKYDMVEVLEDYDQERGVKIAPLVKVAGFRTVFCRHQDSKEYKHIPREEMFRFSHQVPSHLLTGKEGPLAPKDCLEIDPAAAPLELLQVVTDNHGERMGNTATCETGNLQDNVKSNVEKVAQESRTQNKKVVENDAERKTIAKEMAEKRKEGTNGGLLVYKRKRFGRRSKA